MAQLVDWLAGAGARTSSGAPVSSGFAWAYEIGGGTTPATVYSDVAGTVIATQPIALDAAGRATVYTIGPVRFVVQDATFATVSDWDQANVNRAEAVQVNNSSWTNGYLDGLLTAIGASVGGADGMYLESSGATARSIKSKFSELSISVKDFGAKGDGLQVDTTAVQAAINRVGFLGGGEVYFPPGTYKLDQALTLATDGVSFRGAGRTATVLSFTSATQNGIALTGCDGFYIRDLQMTSVTSSGTGIALSTCTDGAISGVYVTGWYVACAMASCSRMTVDQGRLRSPSAAAGAGRSLTLTDTVSVAVRGTLLDTFGAASYGVELLGSSSGVTFSCWFTSTGSSVRFDIGLTGGSFCFVGSSFAIGTAYFSFGASSMPQGLYVLGTPNLDGSSTTSAVGNTQTPVLYTGPEIKLTAASGGAGAVTVASPVVLPASTSRNVFYDFSFVNASGGAVTWTLNAVFVVNTAIPTTDAHTIGVRFRWDGAKLREVSRADTVT